MRSSSVFILVGIVSCNCAGPRRTTPDDSSYEAAIEDLMNGRYPQAHGQFSLAVDHNREDIRAHAGRILAETYRDPDHPDTHMRITRAARMAYTDYRLLDMCGRQMYDYSKGNLSILSQAQALFQAALVLKPDYPSSHYYLGKIYLEYGNISKARKHLLIAAATDSD